MYNSNDGIYVVHKGEEYRLEDTTPFDTLTKCGQCDFMKDGRCTAPNSCLKIEVEYPDSFWKKTAGVTVETGGCNVESLYGYADAQQVIKVNGEGYDSENDTETLDERFVGEFNI